MNGYDSQSVNAQMQTMHASMVAADGDRTDTMSGVQNEILERRADPANLAETAGGDPWLTCGVSA